MIKTITKSDLVRSLSLFQHTSPDHCLWWREIRAGTWQQKPKQRPWRIRTQICSACFLTHLRITCPGLAPPTVGWASHINNQSRKCLTDLHKANLLEVFSQLKFPFPRCLGFCKVEKKTVPITSESKYYKKKHEPHNLARPPLLSCSLTANGTVYTSQHLHKASFRQQRGIAQTCEQDWVFSTPAVCYFQHHSENGTRMTYSSLSSQKPAASLLNSGNLWETWPAQYERSGSWSWGLHTRCPSVVSLYQNSHSSSICRISKHNHSFPEKITRYLSKVQMWKSSNQSKNKSQLW